MSSNLDPLYTLLQPLSSQPECQTCRLCEEHIGLVYLLRSELSGRRLPLAIRSNENHYLRRTVRGECVAFDSEKGLCTIYDDRPLCCRLYPLDLMRLGGQVWWVIHEECPIAQRFSREHKLEILRAMTVALEQNVTPDQLQSWLDSDRISQNIEAFSLAKPTVIKLRLFDAPFSL